MTNYQVGHDAEKAVANFLAKHGFKILDLNWRNKYCEIDIVAEKDKTVHFVEVKYRKTDSFGSGLEYVTPKKLRQMQFAAEMWVAEQKWEGDYQLSAVEVSGDDFSTIELLSEL